MDFEDGQFDDAEEASFEEESPTPTPTLKIFSDTEKIPQQTETENTTEEIFSETEQIAKQICEQIPHLFSKETAILPTEKPQKVGKTLETPPKQLQKEKTLTQSFSIPTPNAGHTIREMDNLAISNLQTLEPNNFDHFIHSKKTFKIFSTASELEEATRAWIDAKRGSETYSTAIQLHDYPGMGIGGRACHDIGVGDTILELPEAILLSPSAMLKHSNNRHLLSKLYLNLRKHIEIDNSVDMYEFVINTLACFLIIEDADPTSVYRAYLDTLPRKFDTPMWWTRTQFDELQGSALNKNLQQKQVMVYTFLEKINRCFKQCIPNEGLLDQCTFEEYGWALSVLWSRSYMIKDSMQIYLTPFADMLNHKEKDSKSMCDDAYFQVVDDRFKVISNVRNTKDHQVFISYGDRPNIEYLVSYGFMHPTKKEGHEIKLRIPSATLEPQEPLWHHKRDLIHAILCSPDLHCISVLCGEGVPPSLMKVMRVYALTVSDFAATPRKQIILENLFQNKRISLANERTAVRYALLTCDYTLSTYPTTLNQDLELFYSGLLEENSPEHVAYRLRILDKKIIVSIKQHFIKYQKLLNEERQQKLASMNPIHEDPNNILNALSGLGLDDVISHFQSRNFNFDEEEILEEVVEDSQSSSETQEDGEEDVGSIITFIPPEVRNEGLQFSSSTSEEENSVCDESTPN